MTQVATTKARAWVSPRRLLIAGLVGLLIGIGVFVAARAMEPRRTTPVYDPPVLAGQRVPGYCSAGFYARRGDTIVLTSSDHCGGEGMVVHDPNSGVVMGVVGPSDRAATCTYPGYKCAASDMNYLVVAPDRIPWGHLNLVDMGTAGYRTVTADTRPLACADIAIGDAVEIHGIAFYRHGSVEAKQPNHSPVELDGSYFPCMVMSDIKVGGGDSGGSVLVRGIPAGVVSRSFDGSLGFTPLAEGLVEMDLTLCATPDCGFTRPAAVPTGATQLSEPLAGRLLLDGSETPPATRPYQ